MKSRILEPSTALPRPVNILIQAPKKHCRPAHFTYSSHTQQSVIAPLTETSGSNPTPNKVFRFFAAIISGITTVFPGIIRFYSSIVRYRTADTTLPPLERLLGFSAGLIVFVVGAPVVVGVVNPGYPNSIINFLVYDWILASISVLLIFVVSLIIGFFVEIQGVFTDHFIRGMVFVPSTILFIVIIVAVVAFCVALVQGLFASLSSISTLVKGFLK